MQLSRLLVLLPGQGLGGAELHTLDLVRAVLGLGVRVALAAEPELIPPLAQRLAGLRGVTLHPAPGLAWSPAEFHLSPPAQARATSALLAETRAQAALLPLPWPTAGLGPARALAAAEVPTLTIAHLVPQGGDAQAIRVLGGFSTPPGRVVAVSAPAARRLEAGFALLPGAVGVVPNGVDVPPEDPVARAEARRAKRAWLGLPPKAWLPIFVGRLDAQKGADLLPAIAQALWRRHGCAMVALGQGVLEEQLETPEGPLRLTGQVADVPDWLQAADAVILPSRLEGYPLVFLEAAARRCPVLATPAALEALGAQAEEFATLVGPDLLAEDIADAFPPGARGAALAEAAHRLVSAQDRTAMLARYTALLRGLLA